VEVVWSNKRPSLQYCSIIYSIKSFIAKTTRAKK
jgi:hypothetical protein